MSSRKIFGLIAGPAIFVAILVFRPFSNELNQAATGVLATTIWMSLWWMFEIIPVPATALLPIILLPLTGGLPIARTTAAYGDKMLFLFMGGFIIAIAMQRWGLHKRIALLIINKIGLKPSQIVLGFMIATAVLSMWISNTATTLMMVTIGMALISEIKEKTNESSQDLFKSLLLGIAYSASTAGVATLVGTPTNPIFVAIAEQISGEEFSFFTWMIFAFPFSLLMIVITWIMLTRVIFKVHSQKINLDNETIKNELVAMGKMSFEEKVIGIVFLATALCWILRSFVLSQFIPGINDTIIAIIAVAVLFIIPSRNHRQILTWEEAEKLPWGVIILFGGGLALAAGFQNSGLADWLGHQLSLIGGFPLFLVILIITLSVNFLTEITSNVATASISLPVLGALAESIGVHPFILMVPATMAASCAFMLPVATAPNAIVFGSGQLKIEEMIRSGILLNIISSLLISLFVYLLLPLFL